MTERGLSAETLVERIKGLLPFALTEQQTLLAEALARFVTAPTDARGQVFILNGYAGTGKTSVVGALTRALSEWGMKTVLMAPTGRAAKVFSSLSDASAWTIHRRIYRMPAPGSDEEPMVGVNPTENTLFIVDEASMIADTQGDFNRSSLLDDLLEYVFAGAPGCRLLLLGDMAQLPPVGVTVSPAMDVNVLRGKGMKSTRATITQTVRQRHGSGILLNATNIRRVIDRPELVEKLRFHVNGTDDVRPVEGHELIDAIGSEYSRVGNENVLLVTRSNRSATQANLVIRSQVMMSEEELVRGERLMVARNNYLWSAKVHGLDFVANGDMITVTDIHGMEMKDGLRFADVSVLMPDRDISFECKIMLDTLTSESASLEPTRMQEFMNRRLCDEDLFTAATPMKTRYRVLKSDPWLNALQVKYAYAVTCHKAQGGQWDTVFVDLSGALRPPLTEEQPDPREGLRESCRWLYTAFTRAVNRLYLVNPEPKMIV